MTTFAPPCSDFEQRVRRSFDRQPFMRTIRASVALVTPGTCVIELAHQPGLTQQHGFLHAGLVGTLADNAAGYAGYSLMREDSAPLTVEYKLNLLNPARGERFIARARVLKNGRTLKICHADVFAERDGQEQHCATALVTVMELANTPDAPNP